jgi:hypothetical protein
MNCQICHHNDLSTWKTPSKTVLFAEAWLGPRDRSGIFSPSSPQMVGTSVEYLAFRHAKKAMAVTGDLSAQMLPRKKFTRLTPDFWDPGTVAASGGRLE